MVRTPAGLQNPLPKRNGTEHKRARLRVRLSPGSATAQVRGSAANRCHPRLVHLQSARRNTGGTETGTGTADSPDGSVEAEAAEAVSALGLQGPAQDLLTRVAQVLVFEAVGQDFPREARLAALQGGRRRRLLLGRHYSGTEPDSVGCVQERKRSRA